MRKSILDQVKERIYELSIEDIKRINESDSSLGINNVLLGLEKECYGLLYGNENQYNLLYVSDFGKLKGYVLRTGLKEKYRNKYVYIFSRFLSDYNAEVDEVDCYNTFQQLTRYALEKDGFMTISEQIGDGKGNITVLLKSKKGLIYVPTITKLDFYKEIFKGRKSKDLAGENKVYLMLNIQNNLIKIGRSIKPKFREKTLQGQEPEIDILTCWIAPNEIETKLKKKFKNKRVRGEWFNLNARDLRKIREFMSKYKQVRIKNGS